MIRSTLFLAVVATLLTAPAVAVADDTFRSPAVAESQAAGKMAAARASRITKAGRISPVAVTVEEVGDADSFGKRVKWLGLMSGSIFLTSDCTPPAGEPANPNCITLNPAPAITSFNAVDLASITLPARSSESLLCHWQTPLVTYSFLNETLGTQSANFRVSPRYRIENEVLDDPALINLSTGLPFAGSFEVALTSFLKRQLIEPGHFETETLSGTRMCIGGLVSKAALVDQFGLTDAQATQFFRKPITITLGITGQARMVQNANINIGTRITGD